MMFIRSMDRRWMLARIRSECVRLLKFHFNSTRALAEVSACLNRIAYFKWNLRSIKLRATNFLEEEKIPYQRQDLTRVTLFPTIFLCHPLLLVRLQRSLQASIIKLEINLSELFIIDVRLFLLSHIQVNDLFLLPLSSIWKGFRRIGSGLDPSKCKISPRYWIIERIKNVASGMRNPRA